MTAKRYNEKLIEDLIRDHPVEFLGEDVYLAAQQPELAGFRPDLLFTAADGTPVIVEVQINALDRQHLYRCLEYRDLLMRELRSGTPRVLLVCNSLPSRYKPLLATHSVEPIVISREDVIQKARDIIPDVEIVSETQYTPSDTPSANDIFRELLQAPTERVESETDAVVFWVRPWRDVGSDFLCKLPLEPLVAPSAPLEGSRDDNRGRMGDRARPVQIILSSEPLLSLSADDVRMMSDWLTLLRHCPAHGHEGTIVLGRRMSPDVFGYEDHIRNAIRKFQPIWDRYSCGDQYDVERVRSDLTRLGAQLVYRGRYPQLVPVASYTEVNVKPGPGPLWRRYDQCLQLAGAHQNESWVPFIRSLASRAEEEWVSVSFPSIDEVALTTLCHVFRHLGFWHCSSSHKALKLAPNQCNFCLRSPRRLQDMSPSALTKAARYFCEPWDLLGFIDYYDY